MIMTQSDWEDLGSLFVLFILFLALVLWVWDAYDDDHFDGGW